MLNTNSLKLLAGSPTYRSKLKMEKERVTMNNFRKFTSDFDKTYLNVKELNKRYAIFKMNMKTAAMLQYKEKGTAINGATQFSDLTANEFHKYHTGLIKHINRNKGMMLKKIVAEPLLDLPVNFDWRKKGAVTKVKKQGPCGSCWAFSVTGNIEGVWKVRKGQLISLSEQQLIDCDKLDDGCNGGYTYDAYKEIARMGGLQTAQDYPYKGIQETCTFKKSKIKAYINASVLLPQNEKQMAIYMYKNGPIAAAINSFPLMYYKRGIAHPWKIFCNPKNTDHYVLIVGYGIQSNESFWIIKNSWGNLWGESGYFRLFRGAGICGIDQEVSSVIVK